ncbi:ArsR/SmtB family transcription factor [Catenuloplanes japonicus]|uniref:ArsR/SmtB family transcription factor n=1 Tax=Catenuloplanes japonicus TaxID=33876 RepID=UPI0005268F7A|nr:helix-turn-helix domain-containing protein [Catenuloplanes japonicus]
MDADVAAVAGLFADRTRASVIAALLDGRALTAGELARACDVTAATISAHLRRLLEADLVAVEAQGRHRYYRLADERAGRAFEALAVLAPVRPVRSLRQSRVAASLRAARTCYDHLAGHAGVRLAEAFVSRGILGPDGFPLLDPDTLTSFGVDVGAAGRSRRSFAHPCLDWSERRHHLAGALGAAVLTRLVELEWLIRDRSSRAVRVTDAGREGLRTRFGCELG